MLQTGAQTSRGRSAEGKSRGPMVRSKANLGRVEEKTRSTLRRIYQVASALRLRPQIKLHPPRARNHYQVQGHKQRTPRRATAADSLFLHLVGRLGARPAGMALVRRSTPIPGARLVRYRRICSMHVLLLLRGPAHRDRLGKRRTRRRDPLR